MWENVDSFSFGCRKQSRTKRHLTIYRNTVAYRNNIKNRSILESYRLRWQTEKFWHQQPKHPKDLSLDSEHWTTHEAFGPSWAHDCVIRSSELFGFLRRRSPVWSAQCCHLVSIFPRFFPTTQPRPIYIVGVIFFRSCWIRRRGFCSGLGVFPRLLPLVLPPGGRLHSFRSFRGHVVIRFLQLQFLQPLVRRQGLGFLFLLRITRFLLFPCLRGSALWKKRNSLRKLTGDGSKNIPFLTSSEIPGVPLGVFPNFLSEKEWN